MRVDRPNFGAHIDKQPGRLILHVPPDASWAGSILILIGAAVFLGGGVRNAALNIYSGRQPAVALVVLFLCVVAIVFVMTWVARRMWQHEFLVCDARPRRIEVRYELRDFRRTNGCPVPAIRAVRRGEPNDPDGTLSYWLEIVHTDGKLRFGYGLTESEADYLASVTRGWLQRHAGWVDPADARQHARQLALEKTAAIANGTTNG